MIDAAFAEGELLVSAISFWEVAMLVAKGRLKLGQSVEGWRREVLDRGLREVRLDGEAGIRAAQLSDLGGDPADRMIVATALRGPTLATADRNLLGWGGDLARIDATK